MKEFGKHRDIEFWPTVRIREVQRDLLREHVRYCVERSPYYRRTLAGSRVDPSRLTLEDLAALPFTDKGDLEEYNNDFLAVSMSDVVDIVLSSGTTGKPTRIMYSEGDLERLAYNEAQSFDACGMTREDIVLLTCTIDRCFVAGLAYFLGVRRIGAAAVRSGHGSMESHVQAIQRMNPTVIIGVPTFLRKLGMYLKENGKDPRQAGVEKLICIGEPLRNAALQFLKLGSDLETLWNAKAFSTYASSETVSTFCECRAQRGGHLHPDLAVVEVVDDKGRALPDGAAGEVVVTPLAIEGMPLIRFRTGDVSFLVSDPCSCGRQSPRLGPIIGRKRQMMKVMGTTLYPQALYSALDQIPGVSEYYVTVTSDDDLADDLVVHVAAGDRVVSADEIADKLQAHVRVKPKVMIEPDAEVRERVYSSQSRKPVRFVDLRKRS